MSVKFEVTRSELILCYHPELLSVEQVLISLDKRGEYKIRHAFTVRRSDRRSFEQVYGSSTHNYDFNDTLYFSVGIMISGYFQLKKEVFRTEHTFYFQENIGRFEAKMFVCYNDVSIIQVVDEIIDSDVFVGTDSNMQGYLPIEAYRLLVSTFPGTAELKLYTRNRIASITRDYFDSSIPYIEKYQKSLDRKNSLLKGHTERQYLINLKHSRIDTSSQSILDSKILQYEQFRLILDEFDKMLNGQYSEKQWQSFVNDIIRFVFPKYIMSVREVVFDGINSRDDDSKKSPDFVLIDANGFVDILEIKIPDIQFLTVRPSYRNNFIPTRELSGAIQQIEKYVFCLNHSTEKNVKNINEKLPSLLPDGLAIEILNPLGILVLGRSNDLDIRQRRDFELIKRQYKHVVEIMTYDDLYQRLKNILQSLERSL